MTPAVPFTVRPSASKILRGFAETSLARFFLRDSKTCSRSDKACDTCSWTKKVGDLIKKRWKGLEKREILSIRKDSEESERTVQLRDKQMCVCLGFGV